MLKRLLPWPSTRHLEREDLTAAAILNYVNIFNTKASYEDPSLRNEAKSNFLPTSAKPAGPTAKAKRKKKKTKKKKTTPLPLQEEKEDERQQKCPYVKWLKPNAPSISEMDPSTPPPRNDKEAEASKYKDHYYAAKCLEIDTLEKLGTGAEVPREEAYGVKGRRVLRGRWVFDHKKDKLGVMFVKARYTVMGNFQVAGVDYGETYAPVMNFTTFRMMLAELNMHYDTEMEQWGIKAA